jgi:DNA-binding MarR family transcriptional regulator
MPSKPAEPPAGSEPEKEDQLFRGRGIAFLTSQVGALSSRRWNERLRAEGLDSRQVMLFWNVAAGEGRSQRELADALGLPGSRIVGLVDALESQGLLERRTDARDRRGRALHLTERGRELMDRIMTISAEHEATFAAGLGPGERTTLVQLLAKLAAAQGLAARVHPDI